MATIYVPEDYITIQGAIDAAISGDIVEISPGVYRESLEIIDKDNLTLICQPATVVLEGENKGGLGIIISANETQIKGLQFFRYTTGIVCTGDNNIIDGSVSSLNIRNGVSLEGDNNIISNCRFKSNLGTGITVMGNYNIFLNNRFESDGVGGIGAGFGVASRNLFYGNIFNNEVEYGIGILTQGSEENMIYKNYVSNSKTAYLLTNEKQYLMRNKSSDSKTGVIAQGNDNIIYDNMVLNSKTGMYVNSNNNKIMNNIVSVSEFCGIALNGNYNMMCNNVISDVNVGVGLTINGVCNSEMETIFETSPCNIINNKNFNCAKKYECSINLIEKSVENKHMYKEVFDMLD